MRAKMILCGADAIRWWARRAAGLLCVVGLGLGVCQVRAQPTRSLVPHSATESHWALLVGVDPSADGTNLAYRTNDVELLAATLRHCGYSEHRVLAMTKKALEPDLQPLCANVVEQVPRFLRKIGAEDRLLVYFAAQAFRDPEGRLYLAPADWDAGDPASTGLATTWLREQLEACPAEVKLLVVDAFVDDPPAGTALVGASGAEVGSALEGVGNLAILASCCADEKNLVWEPMEQSVFGFWLAQALAGHADCDANGQVSITKLYDYVFDKVGKTARLVFGQHQAPVRLNVESLPETSHISQRTSLTRKDALHYMAEELEALARRNGVSRLGVTEFRAPGSDSQTVKFLVGEPWTFGRSYAVDLEQELRDRLANGAEPGNPPFELVPHNELHASLVRGGFSPMSFRTPATRGIDVRGKDVETVALGRFCARTGPVLTLRCDLHHTRNQRLFGRVQATALLSPSEQTIWDGGGALVGPGDPATPGAPAPENPVAPGDQHQEPEVSPEGPPQRDKDFPYQVKIYVDGQPRESTFLGGNEYVPLDRGEVYEILVKNGSDRTVCLRLLVDGLNTLPEPTSGELGPDGQPKVVYRRAQRVSLDEARAWPKLKPHTSYVFHGFYLRIGDGTKPDHGNYEWTTFKVVDPPESLAYQQGYTEQAGVITAAFYAYSTTRGLLEDGSRPRTGEGPKGEGELEEYTEAPVGRPLAPPVSIYYVEREVLDRLRRDCASPGMAPNDDLGNPHDEAADIDASGTQDPPKTDVGEPAEPSQRPADLTPEEADDVAPSTGSVQEVPG